MWVPRKLKSWASTHIYLSVKSSTNLADAELFLAGKEASKPSCKFYAVQNGRVPGIYTDWPSAQRQIIGWSKSRHKCFSTRTEAQNFLDEGFQTLLNKESNRTEIEDGHSTDLRQTEANGLLQKKLKNSALLVPSTTKDSKSNIGTAGFDFYEPGIGLPLDAEDGFDPNVILEANSGNVVFKTRIQKEATKLQAVRPVAESVLRVYTDGSSLRNGQTGSLAGIGVYFGPCDTRQVYPHLQPRVIWTSLNLSRNLSEPLIGPRQTNQRAELTAIVRTLDTVPKDRDVVIVSDSQYAINCATMWYINWRRNGWKTTAGKMVENRDLVENIVSRIEERDVLKVQTTFEWIKGHADLPGNVEADKLAVGGARKTANMST